MKQYLMLLAALLLLGCSDSEKAVIPLGQWIEVSPTDPEAVKAFRAVDQSPAELQSARIKFEQAFVHYELISLSGGKKWMHRVVKERFRMVDIKELSDGTSGGTLVPANDHTEYQLQTLTSIHESNQPIDEQDGGLKGLQP
jgi:hypothetical protein